LTGERLEEDGHPLLQHPELTSQVKGLIDTLHGPLLIVAKPILTNDQQGPPVGTLIMGRFLDESAVARLADQTRMALVISPAGRQAPSAWSEDSRKGLAHSKIELVGGADRWQANSTLSDLYGNPLLTVRADTPRDTSSRVLAAVNSSLYYRAGHKFIVTSSIGTSVFPRDGEDVGTLLKSAVIAMADNMKLRVTAEVVENSGQMNFLQHEKCREAQGFYIGRTMVAEDVERYLHPFETTKGSGATPVIAGGKL
jgi:hypothetical protein